jgi:Flp pilus assembly protein TadD
MGKSDRGSNVKLPSKPRRAWRLGVASVVLAAAWVHFPVLRQQAACFDDQQYFHANPLVNNPGRSSTVRFMTEVTHPSSVRGYYQPLAMISLMGDWALGGRPGNLYVFHRTSLILHLLNVVLVAVLLRSLTGSAPAALAAGLIFAVHPLTVEPLAWVADRKTLLATFFGLASLVSYVEWTKSRHAAWYLAALVAFLLALLSKPTLLPLPVVLLLLDVWPLRRFSAKAIVEKAPDLILAAAIGVITVVSQARTTQQMTTALDVGVFRTIVQAIYLLYFYVSKMLFPVNLCPVYVLPSPMSLTNPAILFGVLVILAILAALILCLRKTPAPMIGAAIFVAAIAPTLGGLRYSWAIAQDKYLYFPALGVLLLVSGAWAGKATTNFAKARPLQLVAGLLVILVATCEVAQTRRQYGIWADTLGLGHYIVEKAPGSFQAHKLLGAALIDAGRTADGIEQYEIGERLEPSDGEFAYNLGVVADRQGRLEDAVRHFRRALPLRRGNSDVAHSLGMALQMLGRTDEAVEAFTEALNRRNDHTNARAALGVTLASAGRAAEAVPHLERAVQEKPDWPTPLKMLAWILATHPSESVRNPARALEMAEKAARLSGGSDPMVLDTLAAALATEGKFDQAVLTAGRAADLYAARGKQDDARLARMRADMYRRKKAFRDRSLVSAPAANQK